jgi:hypothetical protein
MIFCFMAGNPYSHLVITNEIELYRLLAIEALFGVSNV